MSAAVDVYVAGLVASSMVSYRNAVEREGSFLLAAIAHLLWPLSFPIIVVWGLATDPPGA